MGTLRRARLAASFSRTAAATAAAARARLVGSPPPDYAVGFALVAAAASAWTRTRPLVRAVRTRRHRERFVASTARAGTAPSGPPHATGSTRLDTTAGVGRTAGGGSGREHRDDGGGARARLGAPQTARAVVAEVAVRDVESVEPDERT